MPASPRELNAAEALVQLQLDPGRPGSGSASNTAQKTSKSAMQGDRKSLERSPTPEKTDEPRAVKTAKKEQEQPKQEQPEQEPPEQEQGDYSPSASDWEPSGESSSEESEEEEKDNSKNNKMDRSKVRQYSGKTGRKVLKPSHRANAVIPKNLQNQALQNQLNKLKISQNNTRNSATTLPDITKKNKQNGPQLPPQRHITIMKELFGDLFTEMKDFNPNFDESADDDDDTPVAKPDTIHTDLEIIRNAIIEQENVERMKSEVNDTQEEAKSDCEDLDRSNDNILITNKYDTVVKKSKKAAKSEWIPIGSGMTMIHKDKYRKVNWKSYTIATRTLLLAAFTRRTLATHSLTGKKSPAFANKPAKMCLDPKIVSDIVIEVADKFNVKDNLVRSIITTKCADECKMYRMKLRNQQRIKNQENIPPPSTSKA